LKGIGKSISRDSGSILIIALWSICLLATFAVILSYGVRQKAALVKRLDEKSKLRLIAEAGAERAIIELCAKDIEEEGADYDAFDAGWSNDVMVFKNVSVGDGQFSVSYDVPNEKSELTETRYGLVDEESKININKADQFLLRRLFKIALDFNDGKAQQLAAAIVDWRDSDSQLSVPLGSAEDSDYRALKYPYESKDAEFEVPDELLLVKDMDEELFAKLKGLITIYGSGKININTAPSAVLLCLGLGASTVNKIMAFRYGDDNILGTEDDGVFVNHAEIVPKLSRFQPLSDSEAAELSQAANQYLVVKSTIFSARSIAKVAGGRGTAEVICFIDRDGNILYWQES
jgi:type II secretory pathway component PulK